MVFTELRKEKHYTQQRLADALNVRQSTVAMWETKKSVPSMKNLLALSRLLEVSIDTICDSLKADNINQEYTKNGSYVFKRNLKNNNNTESVRNGEPNIVETIMFLQNIKTRLYAPNGLFNKKRQRFQRKIMLFALRFLFEKGCIAEHLLARGDSEFAQNIVVVIFERALLYVANFHNFVCGFAFEIQAEDLFFGFGKGFQPVFEHLVFVGGYLVFARVGKAVDVRLFLFERKTLFVALRAEFCGFLIFDSILLGKKCKKVVDFDKFRLGVLVFLFVDLLYALEKRTQETFAEKHAYCNGRADKQQHEQYHRNDVVCNGFVVFFLGVGYDKNVFVAAYSGRLRLGNERGIAVARMQSGQSAAHVFNGKCALRGKIVAAVHACRKSVDGVVRSAVFGEEHASKMFELRRLCKILFEVVFGDFKAAHAVDFIVVSDDWYNEAHCALAGAVKP